MTFQKLLRLAFFFLWPGFLLMLSNACRESLPYDPSQDPMEKTWDPSHFSTLSVEEQKDSAQRILKQGDPYQNFYVVKDILLSTPSIASRYVLEALQEEPDPRFFHLILKLYLQKPGDKLIQSTLLAFVRTFPSDVKNLLRYQPDLRQSLLPLLEKSGALTYIPSLIEMLRTPSLQESARQALLHLVYHDFPTPEQWEAWWKKHQTVHREKLLSETASSLYQEVRRLHRELSTLRDQSFDIQRQVISSMVQPPGEKNRSLQDFQGAWQRLFSLANTSAKHSALVPLLVSMPPDLKHSLVSFLLNHLSAFSMEEQESLLHAFQDVFGQEALPRLRELFQKASSEKLEVVPLQEAFLTLFLKFSEDPSTRSFLIQLLQNPLTPPPLALSILQELNRQPPPNPAWFSILQEVLHKSTDDKVRAMAIVALGHIHTLSSFNLLCSLLSTTNTSELWLVIHGLGSLRNPLATPYIFPYLWSPLQDVQQIALDALVKLRHPRTLSYLFFLLQSPLIPDAFKEKVLQVLPGFLNGYGVLYLGRLNVGKIFSPSLQARIRSVLQSRAPRTDSTFSPDQSK